MNEEIVTSALFFLTVITLGLGIPLVRAHVRKSERGGTATPLSPELSLRLDRMESMIETVAVEVERLAEGQRFTTRLLSEGAAQPVVHEARQAAAARNQPSGVSHV